MSSKEITAAVAEPEFYQRVAFVALQVAHRRLQDNPDDNSRLYAFKILVGDENALMLAMHVAAVSKIIGEHLRYGLTDNVADTEIEAALEEIWDVRAKAFEAPPLPPPPNAIKPPLNLEFPSPHFIPKPENVPPGYEHLLPPAPPPLPPLPPEVTARKKRARR